MGNLGGARSRKERVEGGVASMTNGRKETAGEIGFQKGLAGESRKAGERRCHIHVLGKVG